MQEHFPALARYDTDILNKSGWFSARLDHLFENVWVLCLRFLHYYPFLYVLKLGISMLIRTNLDDQTHTSPKSS